MRTIYYQAWEDYEPGKMATPSVYYLYSSGEAYRERELAFEELIASLPVPRVSHTRPRKGLQTLEVTEDVYEIILQYEALGMEPEVGSLPEILTLETPEVTVYVPGTPLPEDAPPMPSSWMDDVN